MSADRPPGLTLATLSRRSSNQIGCPKLVVRGIGTSSAVPHLPESVQETHWALETTSPNCEGNICFSSHADA
jgi:hypothetical protein